MFTSMLLTALWPNPCLSWKGHPPFPSTILSANDTHVTRNLLWAVELYWTSQRHAATAVIDLTNLCILRFSTDHNCSPSVEWWLKRKQKRQLLWVCMPFGLVFFSASIIMNPCKKVCVITDSSHHEALQGLAAQCWQGQSWMHQVCNYLSQNNPSFSTVLINFGCTETRKYVQL